MLQSRMLAMAAGVALAGASLAARQQPGHDSMTAPLGSPLAEATATIAGEGITGTATLAEYQREDSRIVHVLLTVSGLKPGLHGVHLHAVGKCETGPPNFVSAGGHFDPGPSGNMDPDANHPFHMGDLPNLRSALMARASSMRRRRGDVDRRSVQPAGCRRLGNHHPRQPRSGHHR